MQAARVNALAEARKKADAYRRQMQLMRDEDNKTLSKVVFEIKTTQKIEQNRYNEILKKKMDARKDSLGERRQKLANILNEEFEEWSSECMNTSESLEERKKKLMEKAYALRDQREAERRKFVEEAYERVWKDSCDDLRDLDGRALDKFMGLEREKQVQEKQERKALEEANANAYYAEWSKRLDAIANADKAKQEARAEANARTARGLQEQMEERKKQYEDRYNRMMQEAAEESAECNAAIQEDRDKQNRLRQEAVERGRQVQEFNRKYKDLADQKAAIEAHQDAVLLQNALKLEKEQIEFEQAKQREGAEAAKQYRKYLEQMMVKEAEDTGFQDEMNRREFEKVQKARDDALQARQDARDYLMKLVHEGREEQIAYKKAQEIKEREEGKAFANKFLENMKSGIAKDKQVAEERRARNINNRQKLQEQMMEQEAAKLAARQEVFLEDKKMRFIENKHREKLARQGGVVRLNFAKQRPDTR